VTPVAPHLAPANSLLLPEGSTVEVEIAAGQKAIASIDGQPDMELAGGDKVRVRTSKHTARFLRLGDKGTFYTRVARRLNWLRE
jgi:NAD kinase